VLQIAGDAIGQVTHVDRMGFFQHMESLSMPEKGWYSPRYGRHHSHVP